MNTNNGRSSHGSWAGAQEREGQAAHPTVVSGVPTPTAEEVISKIKDDGDFDRLRLKIISQLKSNEALRSNIVLAVKRSKTLSNASRNVKPRQLLDAVYQEIGNDVRGQMSDAVWQVIRSNDGMKKEIFETVETVYSKMVDERKMSDHAVDQHWTRRSPASFSPTPIANDQQPNAGGRSSSPAVTACDQQVVGGPCCSPTISIGHHVQPTGEQSSSSLPALTTSGDHLFRGIKPKETPAFSLPEPNKPDDQEPKKHIDEPLFTHETKPSINSQPSEPQVSVHPHVESQQQEDSDLDPDVPPGFG
ncbi:uncharacterized protein LOC116252329 [Nymphaea colorata]|nr:uncharacterized protein LOC116252329 [Nymphaea colorata]